MKSLLGILLTMLGLVGYGQNINGDTTLNKQTIEVGSNYSLYQIFLGPKSGTYVLPIYINYKRRIGKKADLRLGLGYLNFNPAFENAFVLNTGIESVLPKRKSLFSFIYGVDLLVISDYFYNIGFAVCPLVGLEYALHEKLSLTSEISVGQAFGRPRSSVYSYGRWAGSGFINRTFSIGIGYHF